MKRTENFLTVAQVADELGVTPCRVRQLIGAGRLKATRFGAAFAIERADLEAVRVRKPGRPRKAC